MNEISISLLSDRMALSTDQYNFWIYPSGSCILIPYPHSCVITTSPCRIFPLNKDGFLVLEAVRNGTRFSDIKARLGVESEISIDKLASFIQRAILVCILTLNKARAGTIHIKKRLLDPPIERIFIEITSKCNLHCAHCYLSASSMVEDLELTLEDLNAIVKRADELGIYRFDLTGGELFIREDIKEILKILKDRFMMVNLFTNGTLIGPELCRFLSSLGNIYMVFVSLDDIDEAEHDRFRGAKGSFKRTIAGIKLLKEEGFNVILNITVVKRNIPRIPGLIELAKTMGVGYRFAPIIPVGRGKELLNEISEDELKNLMKSVGYTIRTKEAGHSYSRKELSSCGVGNKMLFIRSNGEISLCPTLTSRESSTFKLGRVQEDDIKDIWQESKMLQMFRRTGCCRSDCRHISECHGGCRSRAFIKSGNLSAEDFIACAYFNFND